MFKKKSNFKIVSHLTKTSEVIAIHHILFDLNGVTTGLVMNKLSGLCIPLVPIIQLPADVMNKDYI